MDDKTNAGIQDYYDRKAAANNAEHWREVAERLQAKVKRLEAALKEIADCAESILPSRVCDDSGILNIARQALGK